MSISTFMVKMMTKKGAKIKEKLEQATQNPRAEQEAILFRQIEKTKDTAFGKKLDMASIKTVEDFQSRIPMTDYDDYAPFVERMVSGEKDILTTDEVVHFNVTSGTLGAPKRIPVTERHVTIFSEYYASYLNYMIAESLGYEWIDHKGFSLTEGTYKLLPTGVSVGCASSLAAARIGRMIPFLKLDMSAALYSSPIEARQPEEGTSTRYLHARFALMDDTLSYASGTFSSYLYEIMRYMEDHWEMLVEDIKNGTISDEVDMPDSVRASLMKKLKPMPERAERIAQIFREGCCTKTPIMKKLWPNMSYIICVGGASFSSYTDKLKERYCGADMPFVFLGLSASEGMFSVPVRLNDTSSVLTPNTVFMEFIPVDDENATPLLMDELKLGGEYELLVTNVAGLFRYRMKDVVRVTGFYNKTPMVEFVGRNGSAINMFGEKTSEKALQATAVETAKALGLDLYDYAFYPDSEDGLGHYVMLLELRNAKTLPDMKKLVDVATEKLSEANEDWMDTVQSGFIGPLDVKLLQEETFLLYRDLMIYKGRSAAQLKPIHVLTPVTKRFFYGLLSAECE